MKRLQYIPIFLLSLALLASCSEMQSDFTSEPPEVPPSESMTVDYSRFDESGSQDPVVGAETNHWNAAVVRVLILKAVVDAHLAAPRAILSAAADAEAELTEGEVWEWNYSRSVGGETYEVRLTAEQQGDAEILWRFYVTNSAEGVTDRLFFSGVTAAEARQGTWTYYDLESSSGEPVSSVEWDLSGEESASVYLEVLTDRSGHLGDYIRYDRDGTVDEVRHYDAGEEKTIHMGWDSGTRAGFLVDPDYNGGVMSCWDSDLQDTQCQ